jgi:hypothetical protein
MILNMVKMKIEGKEAVVDTRIYLTQEMHRDEAGNTQHRVSCPGIMQRVSGNVFDQDQLTPDTITDALAVNLSRSGQRSFMPFPLERLYAACGRMDVLEAVRELKASYAIERGLPLNRRLLEHQGVTLGQLAKVIAEQVIFTTFIANKGLQIYRGKTSRLCD